MNRLGEMIYESDFGYRVYAVNMREKATTRISIELYIVSPEDEMSDLITIQKKDLATKSKWADVFWGLEADFGRDDIDMIKLRIMDIMKRHPKTCYQSKETLDGLHKMISLYIRENKGYVYEKNEERLVGIFIKGDYGYIDSEMLDKFVKEYKHVGYKRLEIIKRLKIMGALEGANGRNDVLVSVNGKKRRYYKILLAEELQEEEEYEVYDSPVVKLIEKELKAVKSK